MTVANAKSAQRIEAFLLTMERLVGDMRGVSTNALEATIPATKVTAVKNKLDVVEARLEELHNLMQDAIASSSDLDVAYRAGGGGGK